MEEKKKKTFSIQFKMPSLQFPRSPRPQFRRLVLSGAGILVVIIGIHVYLAYRIGAEDIFGGTPAFTTQFAKVNEKKLTTILSRYDEKAQLRQDSLSKEPPVSDPSK